MPAKSEDDEDREGGASVGENERVDRGSDVVSPDAGRVQDELAPVEGRVGAAEGDGRLRLA